jgi:hypothetical protein
MIIPLPVIYLILEEPQHGDRTNESASQIITFKAPSDQKQPRFRSPKLSPA